MTRFEFISRRTRPWLAAMIAAVMATSVYGQAVDIKISNSGEAAAEATPDAPEPTHQQVKVLTPTFGDAKQKLVAFCLTKDGQVVALLNRVDLPGGAKPARVNIRLRPATPPASAEKKDSAKSNAEKPSDSNAAEKTAEKKPSPAAGRLLLRGLAAAASKAAETQKADSKEPSQVAQAETAAPAKPVEATGSAAELRLLSADGKLVAQWPLDFQAQAVNIDADGNVIVGGDGVVARYDLGGKQLYRGLAPQMAGIANSEEHLENQAREALLSQAAALEERFEALKKQKEDLEAKKDEELTDQQKLMKKRMDTMIASYQRSLDSYKNPTDQRVKQMAQTLSGKAKKINAIAASAKHVFITCGDPKGFGYSVWRTDANFENPKQIVSGLSGCCGQMDVQCCGDEIAVAENSRKRVVRYDADGKKVASFGKASRDGAGDTFGSCCNPMNTRLFDGKLLVSDSDGRVRLFTLDGAYEGEVGKAEVRPGCKSSTVDISPDGNRLYYIDVNTSQICVLEKKPPQDKQASVR